ncbi:hypothetical protein AAFC00_002960 [Neodothiora populina]|uniref:tryptophan--tRNA ligase n=1 Tax=Neodothiora populina TaxID=2781224 RepID=A0ABR3P8T3_9PEZI
MPAVGVPARLLAQHTKFARLCSSPSAAVSNGLTLQRRSYVTPSSSKVIFSGIQPTGVPHLGNYLGALQQWVKLQKEADRDTQLLYSIVDLHAITVPQDRAYLRQCKREMLATLLAIGLDPDRSTIFYQSSVPAHSELMWILSCGASMGYLSRMTQWKSKLDLADNANPLDQSSKSKLKLGLFSYPVLQAADILVHRSTHVPVGHDQSQHLEFARECANGFNHVHGKVLSAPETLLSPGKRVMSLDRPQYKMSKSHPNPKSRILLTDSREEIRKKLRVAVTDSIEGASYDPVQRPGVSNLIEIAFNLQNQSEASSPEDYARDLEGVSLKALKDHVTEAVDQHIGPIRERFESIIKGSGRELEDAAELGSQKANASANATMKLVKDAVGF